MTLTDVNTDKKANREFWRIMDRFAQTRDRRHERATRMLRSGTTLWIGRSSELISIRRMYTYSIINDHFVCMQVFRRFFFTGRWIEGATITFETPDWVRFCRCLGVSHGRLVSFRITQKKNEAISYWSYRVQLMGRRVRLSQQYVFIDAPPNLVEMYRRNDRAIVMSDALWLGMRQTVRRGFLAGIVGNTE